MGGGTTIIQNITNIFGNDNNMGSSGANSGGNRFPGFGGPGQNGCGNNRRCGGGGGPMQKIMQAIMKLIEALMELMGGGQGGGQQGCQNGGGEYSLRSISLLR